MLASRRLKPWTRCRTLGIQLQATEGKTSSSPCGAWQCEECRKLRTVPSGCLAQARGVGIVELAERRLRNEHNRSARPLRGGTDVERESPPYFVAQHAPDLEYQRRLPTESRGKRCRSPGHAFPRKHVGNKVGERITKRLRRRRTSVVSQQSHRSFLVMAVSRWPRLQTSAPTMMTGLREKRIGERPRRAQRSCRK